MMNNINRSINIVAILLKKRKIGNNFFVKTIIFGLNMQEAILKVNAVARIYIQMIALSRIPKNKATNSRSFFKKVTYHPECFL